jgi:hypothetical protein
MAIKEMNAITVADDLLEFLEDHPSHLANVHSVFPHAVNLLIREDELITIANLDDITPMGLAVECGASFAEFFKAGDKVVLDSDRFTSASGNFSVNLLGAEVWQTRSTTDLDALPAEKVAQNRLKLISWLGKQPVQGLLPLLPRLTHQSMVSNLINDNIYSRYVADDLEAFTTAINTSDWRKALNLADRLIGFGMGSTPACDDFLAAYLVVFNVAESLHPTHYPWIWEFSQTIASKAKQRSTLISANMLWFAADGKSSKSHQQLIQTCLFNNNGQLEHSAHQVLQHGATSGGDFMLGLICALEWVQNTMTNFTKEGEHAWVEQNQSQPVPGI